jgi:hypothetical protein
VSQALATYRPEQIPPVAADVQEDRDAAVRFGARRRYEHHPGRPHALKRSVEVVNAQEESDPPRELVPYRRGLGVAVCLSEEQAGARSWRSHNDPALRPTVVGDRARVLD